MSDVTHHHVTGDWRHLIEDGIVDHDPYPDQVLPTGHVKFEPVAPRVAVAGAPAIAYTLGSDTALISDGLLTDMQGRPGIWLVGEIGGHTVRWRATVNLEYRDQKIFYPTVDFDLTEDVRLTGLIQQTGKHTPFVIDPRIEDLAGRLADVDQVVGQAEQIVADAAQSVTDAQEQADRARDEADRAIGLAGAQDEHIAGTLEDPDSATHAAFKAVGNATYDRIDVAPSGVLATDIANVTAAALAAKNEGRKSVRMAPGHYLLDGVDVAAIHDRYLVGDNVTFSPDSWVYPFKPSDLAARSAGSASTGGRGRIAIELDDGLLPHWQLIFPLTKELGITIGTVWHTSNGAKWIAEAHRHGWEVIAHLPENIVATEYRDQGQLDAAAVSCLDEIEAQIGTRRGVGFVYPQHVRDLDTDRILSKYFTYGRGLSSRKVYPSDKGHEWLMSSARLDTRWSIDGVNQEVHDLLDVVAASDGGVVFYFHHNVGTHDVCVAGLRDLVAQCRARGIEIVNPSQIAATKKVPLDTYFERPADTTFSGAMSTDTARAYHGENSAKLTVAPTGATTGRLNGLPQLVPSKPGMFGVYRVSWRRWHDQDATVTSNGQGVRFDVALWKRGLLDPNLSATQGWHSARAFPLEGTTIPSADWERHQDWMFLPPNVEAVSPSLVAVNFTPDSPDIWFDELIMQHMDWRPQVTYDAVLAGTNNLIVATQVIDVASQVVDVIPSETPVGKITAVPTGGNSGRLLIKSTDPADTMPIKVAISPGAGWYSDAGTLSSEGA